jgi:hypothetical protein
MTIRLDQDMAAHNRSMNAAGLCAEAAMKNYMAACVVRDWRLVDQRRLEMLGAVEAQLDAIAMANKRLEAAERDGF